MSVSQIIDGNLEISSYPSKTVLTPFAGAEIVPSTVAVLTAVATANNTTNAETDLLAGGTAVPALTTLSAHVGFPVPANVLQIGRVLRLKCYGTYTTNRATATITPAVRFNTAAASTVVATGRASGTFTSATGPFSWSMEVIMIMLDATHLLTSGSLLLGGNNPATTVSGTAGLNSAAAGVVIVPGSAGNICPTWTGSSNNAGNTFQCLVGTLEILN